MLAVEILKFIWLVTRIYTVISFDFDGQKFILVYSVGSLVVNASKLPTVTGFGRDNYGDLCNMEINAVQLVN